MQLGFSYIGLLFLFMLIRPNLLWIKNKPKDYDRYVVNENKILLVLERCGEVLVSCFLLIFTDFNIRRISWWSVWLLTAFGFMLLYEAWWIRYFRSDKTMQDFYSDFFGVPVAGATLPVIAFLLLAVYGRNFLLLFAVVILGIGHIGIHWMHQKEISGENCSEDSVVLKKTKKTLDEDS